MEPHTITLPTTPEAEALLDDAHRLNPGPWAAHSRHVALAARRIAACCPGLDADRAFILGLLHDIGRREGVTGMRHVLDGYRYLESLGYLSAARICLTHSYPIKTAACGSAVWDSTQEEYRFLQAYLDSIEYDSYDRLIQLCDSLALPTGFCLLEKRLVDVVMRYGFVELTLDKWQAYFAIKSEFDRAIGKPVYSVLPGVVENTFEMQVAA
jgi:hypothetical protein